MVSSTCWMPASAKLPCSLVRFLILVLCEAEDESGAVAVKGQASFAGEKEEESAGLAVLLIRAVEAGIKAEE